MTLGPTGHVISGKASFATPKTIVTGPSSYATLYAPDGSSLQAAVVASDGSFSFSGLADGSYRIRVQVRADQIYAKFYPNAATLNDSGIVNVSSADVSNINLVMDTPATVQAIRSNASKMSLESVAGTPATGQIGIWTTLSSVSWKASSQDPAVSFAPANGTLTATGPAQTLQVSVGTSSLAPGTYTRAFDISDLSGQGTGVSVEIALVVDPPPPAPPKLRTDQRSIHFVGSTTAFPTKNLVLTNAGVAATNWSCRSDRATLYPASGTLAPGNSATLTAAAIVSGTSFGSTEGLLEIIPEGGDALLIPVTVTITPEPVGSNRPGGGNPAGRSGSSVSPLDTSTSGYANVPVVMGAVPGGNGTLWTSDLQMGSVANISSTSLAAPIPMTIFFTLAGSKNGAGTTAIAGSVSAAASLAAPINTSFKTPGGTGTVDVRFDLAQPIAVWSRAWTPAPNGGTYGQEVPALEASSLLNNESGIVPVLLGDIFRSNIFLVETTGSAVTATIQIKDAFGSNVGSPIVKPLAGFEMALVGNLLGSTNLESAYAVVTASGTGTLGALGSIVDTRSGDPTTILMKKRAPLTASGKLLLPVAARGPGAAGSVWRSDAWLVNASASTLSVTPSYQPADGTAAIGAIPIVLAPGAMAWLPDLIQSVFHLDTGYGSIAFTAPSGASSVYIASRMFNVSDKGTYGQGIWPVEAVHEARNGSSIALFGLERSALFRTNLGLIETAGASAKVVVSGGAKLVTYDLTPYQYLQVNDILGALGMPGGSMNKSISVKLTSGVSISAFGSIADMVTSDPTTVPGYSLGVPIGSTKNAE
jgi:Viral BACON domain